MKKRKEYLIIDVKRGNKQVAHLYFKESQRARVLRLLKLIKNEHKRSNKVFDSINTPISPLIIEINHLYI